LRFSVKAKRPKKGGLKINKVKKEIKILPYGCEEGLRKFIKEISV